MVRRIALLQLLVVVTGCSGSKITELEDDIRRLKGDVKDLRAIQAEQTATLGEIRTQVSALGGKFDELQYTAKGKTEQLEQQLRTVSSRVPPPPGVPDDLLTTDDEAISRLSGPAAELFRSSLGMVRTGDFSGASTGLSKFVEENPNTAFTDNALFWLAVSAEKQGQLNQAVIFYSDIYKKFPAEDRVAPALYRLAEAFLKMDSKQEAVLALQKLVDEHGSSEYGLKGKALLSTLEKPKGRRR